MLLDLIAKFLEYLVVWVPRPVLVPKFEALVRWTLARDPRVLRGFVWYVPLIHTVERIDQRAQATEFEPKVLWTRDGREVAIGMAVVWRVDEPVVCAERVDGLGLLVSKLGESVLPEVVAALTLEELKRKAAGGEGREWGINAHLERRLATVFEEYGIVIDKARVNFTSGEVRTIKLIGSGQDAASVAVMGIGAIE